MPLNAGVSLRLPERPVETQRILRRSLHHEIAEKLRDVIVEHRLPPGERIDEKQLCEAFGISRTPLREALKVLESEGLVEFRPNRGARVTLLTAQESLELFEVASGLERLAAELAAERATERQIRNLRKTHDRMVRSYESGERSDYFRLNHAIHLRIVELSRNATLIATHARLIVKIRRARYSAIMSQDRWDESVGEHEALMKALEAREPADAGQILMKHVRKTGEVVRTALAADAAGTEPARGEMGPRGATE